MTARPSPAAPVARRATAVGLFLALTLTACGGDPGTTAPPGTEASASRSAELPAVATTAPAAADEPTPTESAPTPAARACYRLTPGQAVAPTSQVSPVRCEQKHTSRTFAVGQLDTVVDGHLVAVDSARVAQQVATDCPRRFDRFVGGDDEARRLSLLRPVWFTPTLDQSDAGARWFRCDVIALAAERRLAPLVGRLEGVLSRPADRERYALCGTAAPGSPDFARVICSGPHTWRAVRTVDVPGRDFPGRDAVRAAGQGPCETAGRARAADPLEFRWGYEWPTERQWRQGQRYGVCWVPD